MDIYNRYQKLQKYNKDGTPVEPAEYRKGIFVETNEYDSIEQCEVSRYIDNETTCVGTDEYYVETYQQTTN